MCQPHHPCIAGSGIQPMPWGGSRGTRSDTGAGPPSRNPTPSAQIRSSVGNLPVSDVSGLPPVSETMTRNGGTIAQASAQHVVPATTGVLHQRNGMKPSPAVSVEAKRRSNSSDTPAGALQQQHDLVGHSGRSTSGAVLTPARHHLAHLLWLGSYTCTRIFSS
jgi:hypothetical protein